MMMNRKTVLRTTFVEFIYLTIELGSLSGTLIIRFRNYFGMTVSSQLHQSRYAISLRTVAIKVVEQ